ncbi:DUF4209 domain-containing protein [Nanohaloarchaea archaeon]|nr:DUF4209 domain-containing protein [Candidatus Nanohaloarchaea archaeon]
MSDLSKFQKLDQTNWRKTIRESDKDQVENYEREFFDKANQLESNDKEDVSEAVKTLGDACFMYLDLSDRNNPFRPSVITKNGRSARLDDFDESDIEMFKEVIDETEKDELIARLSDIIWTADRDHEYAEKAAKSYLNSADILIDLESFEPAIERIERSYQLASMLNNKELKDRGTRFAESLLDQENSSLYLDYKILDLLYEFNLKEIEDLSSMIKAHAIKSEDEEDWKNAERCWRKYSKIESQRKNQRNVEEGQKKTAENLVKQGDERNEDYQRGAMDFYSKAVDLFKKSGESNKAEETHEKLINIQNKVAESIGTQEAQKIDLSNIAEQVRENTSGRDKLSAVRDLAASQNCVSDKTQIRDQVENFTKNYPVAKLLPATIIDKEGKKLGQRGSINNEDERENVLKAEMKRHAINDFQIKVKSIIEPSRQQIILEHNLKLENLLEFCVDRPFVPPGKEKIFAKGIHHGFKGNFTVACNLLIPQIENSLRHILKQNGKITSSLESHGIQEEYTLNTLLEMEELEDIIGEDILFTLDTLLNSNFGANFRHKTAHGMVEDAHFHSYIGKYTWWLVLHLVVIIRYVESESSEEQK